MSYIKKAEVTQGDYGDDFEMECLKNDSAYDLTDVNTLTFRIKGRQTGHVVSGTPTVVTATSGLIKYTWVDGDLNTADIYDVEVEAVWTGTKKITFRGLKLTVRAQLG